ncbi:hypothetical protein EH165_08980 [Nakamurella antarctica]|uniref:Protein kinase domain-containing protein n=1 Tax=Nakamurella antarctica TaxID=1902245 RepID=A0A3G8ZLZ3_9ACTN|nr:protein kinase [Nakamurella antarctica]AZI58250.1 hypothetical protein EH165_08980 [Nakamurella antarctica]
MTFCIGDYTAHTLVATGSTATVWSGRQTDSQRRVVLKVMSRAKLAQITREAALAGYIDHPHLLPVLDVVADDERAALVMESADRGSLQQLLDSRTLSPGETVTVLAPIAAALALAHERGLTHGDISVSNILFDQSGRPLLADLGAARAAADLSLPVCVTPGYVAPEVARGATPTPAADMFSLGAIALHCLCGRPAWPAEDLRVVAIQATAGLWPDPGAGAGASQTLLTLVRALLSEDPHLRPKAAEVVMDLRSADVPQAIGFGHPLSEGALSLDLGSTPTQEDDVDTSISTGTNGADRPRSRIELAGIAEPLFRAHVLDRGRHAGSEEGIPDDAVSQERTPRGRHPIPPGMTPSDEWLSDTIPHPNDGPGRVLTQVRSGRVGVDATPPMRAPRLRGIRVKKRNVAPSPAGRKGASVVSVVTVVSVVGVLATAAVGAGLWWATTGAPAPAALPAAPGVIESSTANCRPVIEASEGVDIAPINEKGRPATEPVWMSVIAQLDQARSMAFATRDIDALQNVYQKGVPALAQDAAKIAELSAGGYRVDGAEHRILSVELLGQAGLHVLVTDQLPAYPIRDETGTVVGATTASSATTRTMELIEVPDGYRIVSVSTQ